MDQKKWGKLANESDSSGVTMIGGSALGGIREERRVGGMMGVEEPGLGLGRERPGTARRPRNGTSPNLRVDASIMTECTRYRILVLT